VPTSFFATSMIASRLPFAAISGLLFIHINYSIKHFICHL
jgi:hypothetical protein